MCSTRIQSKQTQLCMCWSYFWSANESYMKWHASLDPWALLLFGRLGLGDKNQLLKKRKKEPWEWRVTQLLFLCYPPSCRKDFTFTTARCILQLTQWILTFHARKSLRTMNFVVCGCWFANDFFCKIPALGPLIYWWYYWKMFAVYFYASCFDSRENSIGKNL